LIFGLEQLNSAIVMPLKGVLAFLVLKLFRIWGFLPMCYGSSVLISLYNRRQIFISFLDLKKTPTAITA
jgi:hypothetical protein